MTQSKVSVLLYNKPVGVLQLDHHHKMDFSYHKEASMAISLSMPLKEKTFDDINCRKFFRGLLPENTQTLEAMSQDIGCSAKDTFKLIQHYGKECNGALSFREFNDDQQNALKPIIQSRDKKKSVFNPKISQSYGLFSGNEAKYPVVFIDQKVQFRSVGEASTHFLKMSTQNIILVEYFCLCLAKDLGIHCVRSKLYRFATGYGLLVERYDRKVREVDHLECFHQEDFSQALGYFAINKYEWDKGPQLKECFAILSETVVPAICRLQMVKRVIFNYLLGNTQAHAKNISMLYLAMTKPMLAPMYSVRATTDDTENMAMRIGNSYKIAHIKMSDWQLFCKETKCSFPIVKQMLSEFVDSIVELALINREAISAQKWDVKEIDKVIMALKRRCQNVKNQMT